MVMESWLNDRRNHGKDDGNDDGLNDGRSFQMN
jgi:hypothetical protein